MSKLKMDCGYCGRKCDLDKDFCIPQDSVYVCKSCYDWQNRVADLEAKLAESEREKQYYQDLYFTSVKGQEKLKQQLAEKEEKLEEKTDTLKELRQKCFEEQKEHLQETAGLYRELAEHNQDKISYCIEQLEKVADTIYTDMGRDVYDIIVCQINELKEGK